MSQIKEFVNLNDLKNNENTNINNLWYKINLNHQILNIGNQIKNKNSTIIFFHNLIILICKESELNNNNFKLKYNSKFK